MNEPQKHQWFLERMDGRGIRIAVDNFPFLIGRGTECQIRPASPQVSRIHAELRLSSKSGFLFLVDHDSSNGTFLNDNRITDAVPVNHSDVLTFADEQWRLCEGGSDYVSATRPMKPIPLDKTG